MGECRDVLDRSSRGLSDEILENLADRELIGEDEGGFFLYTTSPRVSRSISKKPNMKVARRFGAWDDEGKR